MRTRRIGDDAMVRSASRKVAVQAAGLVALAMLLLVVLVTVVVVHGQATAADNMVRSTLRVADDVGDPPPGTWLVMGGKTSPGLPEELAPQLTKLRSGAGPQVRLTNLTEVDGDQFLIGTELRNGKPIQVVLDLTTAHQERARLLQTMGFASALGLLFAVLLGVVLGRRAVRPLAQALALQRAFVADAGHELRTPLTLLSTRAQVLDLALQRSGLSAEIRQDSRGVVRDTQRLGEVVEDLLVAADPRSEEAHDPVELGQLTEAVVDSAGAHAASAGVALSWQAEDPPHTVLGSRVAIRRAVLALVDNAIDHTPRDGKVRIHIRRDKRDVVLAVSDTGPGIGPEAAQRVLRRFDSSGRRGGRRHYGLGLALTHDVANRHGGQLRLADSEAGATFELVLPALNGAVPPEPRNR
jgi:two-component system OmpR family sensor kinase